MPDEGKEDRDDDELHVEGDQMPYVWPEGPVVGPVWDKRVWIAISVFMIFVLIGAIVFMATKSWPTGPR